MPYRQSSHFLTFSTDIKRIKYDTKNTKEEFLIKCKHSFLVTWLHGGTMHTCLVSLVCCFTCQLMYMPQLLYISTLL